MPDSLNSMSDLVSDSDEKKKPQSSSKEDIERFSEPILTKTVRHRYNPVISDEEEEDVTEPNGSSGKGDSVGKGKEGSTLESSKQKTEKDNANNTDSLATEKKNSTYNYYSLKSFKRKRTNPEEDKRNIEKPEKVEPQLEQGGQPVIPKKPPVKKNLMAPDGWAHRKESRPSWMPEDLYKKILESVEVLASPESQKVQSLKVVHPKLSAQLERKNYSPSESALGGASSALPQRPVTRVEHQSMVRNFYNDQTFRSKRQKRNQSKIYKLRSFNNCCKYILINKYAVRGGNVLDLGCGKGGDLAKWEMAQIASYVGVDISDQSIREAIHRYRGGRYGFRAIFATGDAYNTPLPDILTNFQDELNLEFDTVSLQFCFHYAFINEQTARHALENISRSLKLGGMFIGTMPSSDFIRWKIRRLAPGEKKWGNSLYSVEFPEVPPKDGNFESAFGNLYTYYLADAVDHVPEYVVPFEKLRALCEEYNMELRYKKNLFEVFNKEIPKYFHRLPHPLMQSLRREDGTYGISGEDRDACSFYLAFAFEKTSC